MAKCLRELSNKEWLLKKKLKYQSEQGFLAYKYLV